jgi:surface polysaccharide O-acyltransferase-like enzyme
MAYFSFLQPNRVMADFFSDDKSSIYQWFHFFFRTFMSSLYFLPLIVSIYLLTPILRVIVKHATDFDKFYILTLWFILLSVPPWIINGPLFPTWEATSIHLVN